MAKTRGGQTSRQRRKERKMNDAELLKEVQSGIPLDELYPEEETVEKNLPDPQGDIDLDIVKELSKDLEEQSVNFIQVQDETDPPESETTVRVSISGKGYSDITKSDQVEFVFMEESDEEDNPIEEKVKEMIGLSDDEPEEIEKDEFDFDLASIDMLLALSDQNAFTKVTDWLSKAVLTSSARTSLKDSDFALVVERDGQKVRKYPIHDKSHVRNALARAAQMIKKGGQAAKDARAALPKIRAAAKRLGIGSPSKKNSNAIIVNKDVDGEYRYVGWLTGKWIDREKEILSDESHQEFVDFLKNNRDWKIDFRSWHMPGSHRTHPIDFWTYEKGFVIVSGKLTEDEAVRLMKAMQKQRIGMSHGFFGIRDGIDNRIIRKYRTFEVSDLPLDHAAFPWSDLSTLMEAKSMKTQLQYLRDVLGEDRLKSVLEDTEFKAQILESTGIEEKALDAFLAGEEIIEEPEAETKEVEQEDSPELTPEMIALLKSSLGLEEFDLGEIKEMLEKSKATATLLPVLMQKIDTLSTQLEEKEKSADEKLAELLSGSILNRDKIEKSRATNKGDNEPDEELAKSLPKHENSWLAEQAGVKPVTQ